MMSRKKEAAATGTTAKSDPHSLYRHEHQGLPLWESQGDFEPHSDLPDGKSLRDDALALLEARRGSLIGEARCYLLRHLLEHGTATADDIRAAMTIPAGVNPVFLGAVPAALARARIIVRVGYAPSRRPERHRAPTAVWALADRAAARRWLAAHGGKGVADE